ncbi:MAG: hypothetical protein CME19_23390 [Gemmatimonadetes bacterium]|nr:hypothetical protein [Gemmatimonadota bacterium]|tara:strand:- start:1804 stop:2562 length:759 start_codon:yes stop_codon:yes gene_type:complete
MKAIILAAGYATRLYPLTENFPKPLLELAGKTILDHLIDQLREIPDIDAIHLVTNHKFASHFETWMNESGVGDIWSTKIHDDGTTSADDRLGAIPDLQFVLESEGIEDDLLVTAADNILQFSLHDVVKTWKCNEAFHICVRHEEDVEDLKKRGNAILDDDDRLVDFIEKPPEPKSNWVVPPIYIYPKASLPQIPAYLEDGKDKPGLTGDSPGQIVEWLYTRIPVYAHRIEGTILDIGNHDNLAEARKLLDSP